MADYRLVNREFSRVWRRTKRYSNHEIRWLARRRGLEVKRDKAQLVVYNPATEKRVAVFDPINNTIDIKRRGVYGLQRANN